MFRSVSALLLFGTLALSATQAHGQWFDKLCDTFHRDYHRNVAWPEPFLKADREAVNLPFGIQVANGWRRQNLLSDYHFNEENPQLNQAGELKLHFILTQMPPNRRTVYVQQSINPDVTSMRMAVVQRTASRMVPYGQMVDVVESNLPNDGWPADEIDAVSRSFSKTRPDPRLKSSSSGPDNGGSGQ